MFYILNEEEYIRFHAFLGLDVNRKKRKNDAFEVANIEHVQDIYSTFRNLSTVDQ